MLTVLALVVAVSTPSPQCEYYRYMAAAVWSALDDAERAGASLSARNNLEQTLNSTVKAQRGACSK